MSRRDTRGRTRRCAKGAALRRHQTAGRAAHLRSEALATFAPATLEDGAAAAGAHPGAETVGLGPLPLLRLVGALHCRRKYTDGAGKIFSAGFARRPDWPPQARRYGRRPVPEDSSRHDLDALWRQTQERLRGLGPGVDLPPLARAAEAAGAEGDTLFLTAPEGIRAWSRAALLGADRRSAAGLPARRFEQVSFAEPGPLDGRAASTTPS